MFWDIAAQAQARAQSSQAPPAAPSQAQVPQPGLAQPVPSFGQLPPPPAFPMVPTAGLSLGPVPTAGLPPLRPPGQLPTAGLTQLAAPGLQVPTAPLAQTPVPCQTTAPGLIPQNLAQVPPPSQLQGAQPAQAPHGLPPPPAAAQVAGGVGQPQQPPQAQPQLQPQLTGLVQAQLQAQQVQAWQQLQAQALLAAQAQAQVQAQAQAQAQVQARVAQAAQAAQAQVPVPAARPQSHVPAPTQQSMSLPPGWSTPSDRQGHPGVRPHIILPPRPARPASAPHHQSSAGGNSRGNSSPAPPSLVMTSSRALTPQQRDIRDGDFQVQRAAAQRASEDLREAFNLSSVAQKQLADLSKEAAEAVEKAGMAQELHGKAQSSPAPESQVSSIVYDAGSGSWVHAAPESVHQQYQTRVLQESDRKFNESVGAGNHVSSTMDSVLGTMKQAAQRMFAAADVLQALAKLPDHVAKMEKARQLSKQSETSSQRSVSALSSVRQRLQAASDEKDFKGLSSAAQALKTAVIQVGLSASSASQAVQIMQEVQGQQDHIPAAKGATERVSSKAGPELAAMPGPTRDSLPIDDSRDEIVAAIRERTVVCIEGDTGCGKSSRVPQYVYCYCRGAAAYLRGGEGERMIVCTQPSDLAVLALARRVSSEMGEKAVGGLVGYRVSNEALVDPKKTKILFVTVAQLVKELVHDPSHLSRFSHVIMDEAHERSVDLDLLALILKLQLLHKTADFKVVVMSATLQCEVFAQYFQNEGDERKLPKPILAGVKRYGIDVLYLDEVTSVLSGPVLGGNTGAGTALGELLKGRPGRTLSSEATKALNASMESLNSVAKQVQSVAQSNPGANLLHSLAARGLIGPDEESDFWRASPELLPLGPDSPGPQALVKPQVQRGLEQVTLELIRAVGSGGETILVFLPGPSEVMRFLEVLRGLDAPTEAGRRRNICDFRVLPLHTGADLETQKKALEQPGDDLCQVLLAASVAESSITLPKARIVIDFCLRRTAVCDRTRRGCGRSLPLWASQSLATQRTGRTGRVFSGISIRMVPQNFFTTVMPEHDAIDMEPAPLEKLFLKVAHLSQRIRETMPRMGALPPRRMLRLTVQAPPPGRVEEAVAALADLGALSGRSDDVARITVLGRLAILLPLDPRLCRLVLFGALFGCTADAVVMATALSGNDPFIDTSSTPMKEHNKLTTLVKKVSEDRDRFDAGTLSEPLMLRNLFVEWLNGFEKAEDPPSPTFLRKQAEAFAAKHAVDTQRLLNLAGAVAEVARTTATLTEPGSQGRRRLEALVRRLGCKPVVEGDGTEKEEAEAPREALGSLFSQDSLLLKIALTAAFAPLFAHGVLRCVDYRSVVAGPPPPGSNQEEEGGKVRAHVIVSAEPQLAKLHQKMLREAETMGGPRHTFCIPHVADFCARQPEAWDRSMRCFLGAGKAKFKKLHLSEQQAFASFEAGASDEDSAGSSSEEDDAVVAPLQLEEEEAEQQEEQPDEATQKEEEQGKPAEGKDGAEAAKEGEEPSHSSDSEASSEADAPKKKRAKGQDAGTALATVEGAEPAQEPDADQEMERELQKALQSKGSKGKQAELMDKEAEGSKEKKSKKKSKKKSEKDKDKDKDRGKRSRSRGRKRRSRSRERRRSRSQRHRSRSKSQRKRRSRSSSRRTRSPKRPKQPTRTFKVLQADIENFVAKCAAERAASGTAAKEEQAAQPGTSEKASTEEGTPLAQLLRGTMPQTESSSWKDLPVPKPTLETAFEEIPDTQKERQRKRQEKIRVLPALQGGDAPSSAKEEAPEGAAAYDPEEEVQKQEGEGDLSPGQCVEAFGLESESGKDLNGQRGTVVRFLSDSKRFEVKFAEDRPPVSLKAANLRAVNSRKRAAEDADKETPSTTGEDEGQQREEASGESEKKKLKKDEQEGETEKNSKQDKEKDAESEDEEAWRDRLLEEQEQELESKAASKAEDGAEADNKTDDTSDQKKEAPLISPEEEPKESKEENATAEPVKLEQVKDEPAEKVKDEVKAEVKDEPSVKEEMKQEQREQESEVKEEIPAKEEPTTQASCSVEEVQAKEERSSKEEPKSEGEDEKPEVKEEAQTAVGTQKEEPAAQEMATTKAKKDELAELLGKLDAAVSRAAPSKPEAASPAGEETREQDLESLPVVELRRQLRAKGVELDADLQDKDELVELLRMARAGKLEQKKEKKKKEPVPVDDAFAAFLQEISGTGDDTAAATNTSTSTAAAPVPATDKKAATADAGNDATEPAAMPVDLAFEAFLQEIDGLPSGAPGDAPGEEAANGETVPKPAEEEEKPDPDAVRPTAEQPLLMRFVAKRAAWVVARLGKEEQVYSLEEDGPIEACRRAVAYHKQQAAELEAVKADKEKENTQPALTSKAASKVICRDLDFSAMRLLTRYGGGKRTIMWPITEVQCTDVEQRCEIARPLHPFQLHWRVCLGRQTGTPQPTFGLGSLWSSGAFTASCPSKVRLTKLRKLQAEREEEQNELQRRVQLEHQARITAAMAAASNPLEATMAMQVAATQAAASLAAVSALADRPADVRWTRRLERLAVYAAARGCEHAAGHVQLDGLTVLPDEDGSNALPVLLLLAFLRPHVAGASRGGCSAYCDLDELRLRAVSVFGPSEDSRWVLSVSKRRRLTLDDMQRANELRIAVSKAFGIQDADPADNTAAPAAVLREDVQVCKALGELIAQLGCGLTPEAAEQLTTPAKADLSTPDDKPALEDAGKGVEGGGGAGAGRGRRRQLGDVWLDLEEAGARYEESSSGGAETAEGKRKRQAQEGEAGPFFSFDVSVEELAQSSGEPEAETDQGSSGEVQTLQEPKGFALLPELTLRQDVVQRATAYRRMIEEAKELAASAKHDARMAAKLLFEVESMESLLVTEPEKAQAAWDAAMAAEGRSEVDQAMHKATSTMKDVNRIVSGLIEGSNNIGTLQTTALGRQRRCSEGFRQAPRFWAQAAAVASAAAELISGRAASAERVMAAGETPKAQALRKADRTVQLVNEKLQRWADEQRILREEARTAERARVAQAQQAAAEELRKQKAELQKQQEEMMQRREAAIQWGRNLVEPIPNLVYAPGSAGATAAQQPPPQPPGLPPPSAGQPPGPPPGMPPSSTAAGVAVSPGPPGPPRGPPPTQDLPLHSTPPGPPSTAPPTLSSQPSYPSSASYTPLAAPAAAPLGAPGMPLPTTQMPPSAAGQAAPRRLPPAPPPPPSTRSSEEHRDRGWRSGHR